MESLKNLTSPLYLSLNLLYGQYACYITGITTFSNLQAPMTSRRLTHIAQAQQRSQDPCYHRSLLQIIRQLDSTLTTDYHTWIHSSAKTSIRPPTEHKIMSPASRLPSQVSSPYHWLQRHQQRWLLPKREHFVPFYPLASLRYVFHIKIPYQSG